MQHKVKMLLTLTAALAMLAPVRPALGAEQGSLDTLKKHAVELRKSPADIELRQKIFKLAQSMRSKPPVPEEAERAIARGNAFYKRAADSAGFKKAADEFQEAVNAAPWLAEAYLNLGLAQGKAGLYADAVQNLKFCLQADPNIKSAREIKNEIYELEVFAEEAHQGQKQGQAPQGALAPQQSQLSPVKAPQVSIATIRPQAPQEKKLKLDSLAGSWFSKDTDTRGEEVTVQAFTLSLNPKGELIAAAPRRTTGAVGHVTVFEIAGRRLKIQVTWKISSVPGYWKTEDYDVVMSDDDTKLTGTFRQKSSGSSKDFTIDRTFFKQ